MESRLSLVAEATISSAYTQTIMFVTTQLKHILYYFYIKRKSVNYVPINVPNSLVESLRESTGTVTLMVFIFHSLSFVF